MKTNKLQVSDPDTVSDELLPEYRFDYSKARPNRFAAPTALPQTTVTLAPARISPLRSPQSRPSTMPCAA